MDMYRSATWGTWLWDVLWFSIVAITDHFFDKLAENLDGQNDLDMFVKSDQEITDEQAVYLGWEDLHTSPENMDRWS